MCLSGQPKVVRFCILFLTRKMIKEVVAKSILTKHEHEFPTLWDANPYRGCTIGCKYCFAQYSHQYLGLENFFKDIIVKINVAEQLHKDFCKKSWQYDQIKLGGITDIYQHAESKYELLPKVIDVLKKHRNPVFIQTKSTLILRDFELIKELANYTTVDIATSISTFDESYRMKIEPEQLRLMKEWKCLESSMKCVELLQLHLCPLFH